ncbi:MAG: AAA family ATPase [Solidesulfovibrio sp. DCME]|uniref:AAA family ATPase n=1 Tax=Solidesulfovibrio sp. DCME TaxID=3447380 RepID=UPI003D0C1FEF
MGKNFSSEFCLYVGESNIVSDCLFSAKQVFSILNANLECLLSYSCRVARVNSVEGLNFVRNRFSDFFCLQQQPMGYNLEFPILGDPRIENFRWEIDENNRYYKLKNITKKSGQGFVDLYATIYGISILEAFKRLAGENKLTESDLFIFSKCGFSIVEDSIDQLDVSAQPKTILCDSDVFHFKSNFFLCKTDSIVGSLALYEPSGGTEKELLIPFYVNYLSDKYVIPCNVSGNEIPPGKVAERGDVKFATKSYLAMGQKDISKLFGSDVLRDLQPDTKILLCEDPVVAIRLKEFIRDKLKDFDNKYFVTMWYGGYKAIDGVDFGYLHERHVIFLPALKKMSYVKILKCQKKCVDVMVKKFSILLDPVLTKTLPRNGLVEKMNPFEKLLADKAVNISELNNDLFLDILGKSVSHDEFLKIGKRMGLFNDKVKEDISDVEFPPSINTTEIVPSGMNRMVWDNIFQHNDIGLVLGPSHSGKTIFLMSILYAISYGVTLFGIKVMKSRRVLLIDGETSPGGIKEMFRRIQFAYPLSKPLLENDPFRYEGYPRDHSFNFSERASRQQVEKWLESGKIDVVAFDNLNTLLPGNVQKPCMVTNFLVWVKLLQSKFKISIVLAHHTKDTRAVFKKASGSKELEERSQTIIALTNRFEIKEKYKNNENNAFFEYIDKKGALFEMHVKKCKHVHEFDGARWGCYLPLNVENSMEGPVWHIFAVDENGSFTCSAETCAENNENYIPEYDQLSEDEKRIMVELAHKKNNFTRGDVDSLLKRSGETSRNRLKLLIAKNLIEKKCVVTCRCSSDQSILEGDSLV